MGSSRWPLTAEGLSNSEIAGQLGISRPTVTKWRNRFGQSRLEGLLDEPRPGRPRTITDEHGRDDRDHRRLESKRRRTRRIGRHGRWPRELGVTQNAVWRIWQAFGLQPHRQEKFEALQGPAVRREGLRHLRPVPEPARAGGRVVRGRGDPNAVGNFEFECAVSRPAGRSLS